MFSKDDKYSYAKVMTKMDAGGTDPNAPALPGGEAAQTKQDIRRGQTFTWLYEHIMCEKSVSHLMRKPGDKDGWVVPLKVDVEFGDDWTVPFNLTEMAWNQGGGDWSERWIKAFPNFYRNYLACGGTPVEGVEVPPSSGIEQGVPLRTVDGQDTGIRSPDRVAPPPTPSLESAGHQPEREGSSYIFRVKNLTASNAKALAEVVSHCTNRGVDVLHIKDSKGNDLVGHPVRVAYEEFRVLAGFKGLM